jgi:hypothetical protein
MIRIGIHQQSQIRIRNIAKNILTYNFRLCLAVGH